MRIRGIPLRIHPSWFVILLMATLAFEQHYRMVTLDLSDLQRWSLGLVTALLLFVSVLLHELGHALVALAQGVQVRSITLFLLGGVASVERECNTAIGALLVAMAGPAVSLGLGLGLLALIHGGSHLSPVLGEVLSQLAGLNLVLGLFNLLPGLPLDGGLIVKAIVWQLTGSRRRGVEVANSSGRFLAFLAIGLGSVLLLRGGGVSGAWLLLLGWFGLGSARNQRQMLLLQQALKDLKVRDVAQRRFRVLEANTSLRDLSLLRIGAGAPIAPVGEGQEETAQCSTLPDWMLVCDRGRWQGVIDDGPLQQLPVQCWEREQIGNYVRPLSSLTAIHDQAPLWQAALLLDNPAIPRLLVLSPAGLPCGTLERPELGEGVLVRLGLRLPAKLLAMARQQNSYPLNMALGQVARGMVSTGDVAAPIDSSTR